MKKLLPYRGIGFSTIVLALFGALLLSGCSLPFWPKEESTLDKHYDLLEAPNVRAPSKVTSDIADRDLDS
jgi:hypothetical protein